MPITSVSKYPGAIDGYTELPPIDDKVTEIDAQLPNAQTDAILKIETTLGRNPQGSKPNLAERLEVSVNPDGTLKPIPSSLFSAEIVQDRNIQLTGGGIIKWDVATNTLSWTERLEVRFPVSGNAPTLLDPNSIKMPTPNSVLAVLISRGGAPQLKPAIPTDLADPILNNNDAVILAWRDTTNKIFWKNGAIYEDRDELPFERIDATRINFKPQGTNYSLTVNDVQTALEDVDNRIVTNDGDTQITIATREAESVSRDNNIQAQIDDTFTHQDRNLFVLGGGDYTFNSGTGEFTFASDIRIFQTTLAGDAIIRIASSPITLSSVGDFFYIPLDRTAIADYDVVPVPSTGPIAISSAAFLVGMRISTNAVRLANGQVIFSDSTVTAYGEGETTANNVKFDNATAGIPNSPDTVQKAIDEMDARLDSLDATVGGNNFVPAGGVIIFEGSTCPTGYIEVPELDGLFIKGAATGDFTPIGTNTHLHTGGTNTSGDHAHSISDIEITLPIQGFSLGGGGVSFDAFDPTFSSATPGSGTDNKVVAASSGNVSSAGAHSHTFTTASQNHEPQHANVKFCKSA